MTLSDFNAGIALFGDQFRLFDAVYSEMRNRDGQRPTVFMPASL